MGKGRQKPQRNARRERQVREEDEDPLPSSAFDTSIAPSSDQTFFSPPKQAPYHRQYCLSESPSKYELYQASVQSPKGDISYLQKFFHLYIGGRSPLHLREDFCGTAILCAEWLKGGVQRLATGLDLDLNALLWGLSNNFKSLGGNTGSRVQLWHGNVLQPISAAKLVSARHDAAVNGSAFVNLAEEHDAINGFEASLNGKGLSKKEIGFLTEDEAFRKSQISGDTNLTDEDDMHDFQHNVDIVCAFNYSCCCLHNRADLILYFKHVCGALSEKGGIFVMDLYGGTSSEGKLKLRRHFSDFNYIWEQQAFDVISRMTKISLHYQLKETMIRQAFTYDWRLWSLPEVRDCLKDAGFFSVHFWMRSMPGLKEKEENEDTGDNDCKYEETYVFYQQSAWNAYIVAVAPCRNNVT